MLTDYLPSETVFFPKALLQETESSETYGELQLALQEEQLYAVCGVRLKNFYSSNLLCICPSSLETNLNKPKYNICKKLSSVFSVAGSRCEEK